MKEEKDNEDKSKKTSLKITPVPVVKKEIPKPDKKEEDIDNKLTGSSVGIGKASSFMSALNFSWSKVLFSMLLMVLVLGTLYKYGWGAVKKRRKHSAGSFHSNKDRLGLESYLDERSI